MTEIVINGRKIPLVHIDNVYMDERGRFMAMVYGESDIEINTDTADALIEAIPQTVEQSLIDQRKKAAMFREWAKDR